MVTISSAQRAIVIVGALDLMGWTPPGLRTY